MKKMDLKKIIALAGLLLVLAALTSFASAEVTYVFGKDNRTLIISPSQYVGKCEEFSFYFPDYPTNYTTDSSHRIQITYYKMFDSGNSNPKTETMCVPGNYCQNKKAFFKICDDGKYHFTIKHQYRVLGVWLTGNSFGTAMFIGNWQNNPTPELTADFTYYNTRPGTQPNSGYSRLDASASHSSSGHIVKYKWDFDAGDPVTGHKEFYNKAIYDFYWTYDTHGFVFEADVPVTLTVTDDQGRTASITKTVHVYKVCCEGCNPPCPTPTPPCPTPTPPCPTPTPPCPTPTPPCPTPSPTPTPPCCPEGWIGQPYCKNGDLYQMYQFLQCNTYCTQEERLKEDCAYGCENGQCKQPCTEGFFGETFCKYGDVYQKYRYVDCSIEDRKIQECGNADCYNGQCGCPSCNHAPTTPGVFITPASPFEEDDLVCHASSMDYDNDPIYYTFTWKRNGFTYRIQTTTNNTNTIHDSLTSEGEEWECIVKACDYSDCSGTASDNVLIQERGHFCSTLDLEIIPEFDSMSMTRNERNAMAFSIKNNSNERVCFNLEGSSSSNYINAEPSSDYMCLNGKERREITLSIETIDAQCSDYYATLIARNDCDTDYGRVNVEVYGCGCTNCISLEPFRGTVCKGKDNTLRVKVQNNYSTTKRIKLSSESTEFLASFEDNEIELGPHESGYVDLTVYADSSVPSGEGYVFIYGKTETDYVRKNAFFDVRDCGKEKETTFEITMSESCSEIEKERDYNFAFEVKSLSDKTQVVNLQTVSDLVTEISEKQIVLAPRDTETLKFTVSAEKSDSVGTHEVEVFGWNSYHREKKIKCIEVLPLSRTKVTLKENYLFISQCGYGVFTLVIENQGDKEEHYFIRANNPTPATVTFSENEFTVGAGETIEIFVSVNVPPKAELGSYEITAIIENSEVYAKTLNFTVVKEKPILPGGELYGLVFTSYPSQAVLSSGKDKNISLKVTNFTGEDLTDIGLEFELPEGFSTTERKFSLAKGKTQTIMQKISASEDVKEGYYDANIVLLFDGNKTVKKLKLIVSEETAEEKPNLQKTLATAMAGLVSLAPIAGMGLIILLIIILVLLVLGVIAPRWHSRNSIPVWRRR